MAGVTGKGSKAECRGIRFIEEKVRKGGGVGKGDWTEKWGIKEEI